MATLPKLPSLTLYSVRVNSAPINVQTNITLVPISHEALKTDAITYALVYDQPNYAGNARLVLPNTNVTNLTFPVKSVKVSTQPFGSAYALLQQPTTNAALSPKPKTTDVPHYTKKYEKYAHDPKDYFSISGPALLLSDIFFLPGRLIANLLIHNASNTTDPLGAYFLITFLYIIVIFIAVLAGLGYDGYKLWQSVFDDNPTENPKHSQQT